MRFTPLTIALAVGALTVSSASLGQEAARAVAPASIEWTRIGDAALSRQEAEAATDAYETAIAISPANVRAFTGLAAAAVAQELPGKAIRFYREALLLDDRDRQALSGIGVAFADKGAIEQARASLARLEAVCGADCPERTQLVAALERDTVQAAAVEPRPVVEQTN